MPERSVLKKMKKIICAAAVLTVLAAVLVFVGRRKNGGEPSASESAAESGENGELYEFVASEKAAAQVQGIAEVLGVYDFVGLSGV